MERNAPTPDIFEAVITAFADTLIRSYRERWNRGGFELGVKETATVTTTSPWLTVDEAAVRAQCGKRFFNAIEVREGSRPRRRDDRP
jgi:hypothetical protein